jgi:hypothetical protein
MKRDSMDDLNSEPEYQNLRSALQSFTFKGYQEALIILKTKGSFQCSSEVSTNERRFFLRHDIDYAPNQAAILGEIEHENGIHAHYYFLTDSIAYNVHESSFKSIISQLIEQNHCIGLHYERLLDGISSKEEIRSQARVLSEATGVEIDEFSVHNPGGLESALQFKSFDGFTNVYEFVKRGGYLSDSNCRWEEEYLSEFLESQDKDFQILIHPEWWSLEYKLPLEKILAHQTQKLIQEIDLYQHYLLHELKYDTNQSRAYIKMSNELKAQINRVLDQYDQD